MNRKKMINSENENNEVGPRIVIEEKGGNRLKSEVRFPCNSPIVFYYWFLRWLSARRRAKYELYDNHINKSATEKSKERKLQKKWRIISRNEVMLHEINKKNMARSR